VSKTVADMIEIEDFLPGSFANILDDMICKSGEFLWQYNASTNDLKNPQIMNKNDKSYDGDQFVHALYQEGARRSEFFDIVFPMFYFVEDRTGVVLAGPERMKANLLVRRTSTPTRTTAPHRHP
jgi:hypothetical protein